MGKKLNAADPHRSTKNVFPGAPSRNLVLPANCNLTATEVCTFCPNWLRSHDVVLRLSSNGVMPSTAAHIIGTHRKPKENNGLSEPITPNTLQTLFKAAMTSEKKYWFTSKGYLYDDTFYFNEDSGRVGEIQITDDDTSTYTTPWVYSLPHGTGWTHTLHQKHEVNKKSDPRNPKSLELTGKPQCEDGDIVNEMPFASFAEGVEHFPCLADGDGLDFTRVIQFVLKYPKNPMGKEWMYPGDLQTILNLIGRVKAEEKHYDQNASSRYMKASKLPTPKHNSKDWQGSSLETLTKTMRARYIEDGLSFPHEEWMQKMIGFPATAIQASSQIEGSHEPTHATSPPRACHYMLDGKDERQKRTSPYDAGIIELTIEDDTDVSNDEDQHITFGASSASRTPVTCLTGPSVKSSRITKSHGRLQPEPSSRKKMVATLRSQHPKYQSGLSAQSRVVKPNRSRKPDHTPSLGPVTSEQGELCIDPILTWIDPVMGTAMDGGNYRSNHAQAQVDTISEATQAKSIHDELWEHRKGYENQWREAYRDSAPPGWFEH